MNMLSTHQRSTGPVYPSWSETFPDHSYVRIRPRDPRQNPAEQIFLEVSPNSQRFRLLGHANYPDGRAIDRVAAIKYVNEVEFIGVTPEGTREKIVGVSRCRSDAGCLHCECVVTIDDEWRNGGLPVLLMKHLIEVARANGIRWMTSVDLAANLQMKDLTTLLGFRTRRDPHDPRQVLHELDL